MTDRLWEVMQDEACISAKSEPTLASSLNAVILAHSTFESSLSHLLAQRISCSQVNMVLVKEVIEAALSGDPGIGYSAREDIKSSFEQYSASAQYSLIFLNCKGFQALQCHRIAHWLWGQGRTHLAYFLQSQSSLAFAVDIHPAARIGCGVRLNCASGIVIGETAVIEDDVSIMQSVTLGGTGKEQGNRHPKIRKAVKIGAGAIVLGDIEIGEGAVIGAGSVVLKAVEPFSLVAGVPAVRTDQSCGNWLNSSINKNAVWNEDAVSVFA